MDKQNQNLPICKTFKISKNFEFDGKLSYMYFDFSNDLNNHQNKKHNLKIEKLNNSTLVILIFEISNSRNISRSTFDRFKF